MAEVTFVGAYGTVTGSCTWLRFAERNILVDCGLFQGDETTQRRNWNPFPFAAPDIDAVVVTHGHLDHVGLLPRLVAEGFHGPIHCTKASVPLIGLVLEDSAELQEEAARRARRHPYSRHPDPRPLYSPADARRARQLLQGLVFDTEREILPGVHVRFRRAGHLLGAASVEVRAKGSDGERRTWCFSGDVGRYGAPILVDPQPPSAAPDALILESTYGDRAHGDADPRRELRAVIERAFARGGMVIIPAFALGRTQEVLYHLGALAQDGFLGPDQVFLDSPMAIDATSFYRQFHSEHDADLEGLERRHLDPLGDERFKRLRRAEESKTLNRRDGGFVVVASSGMAEGGRVVHHLRQRLPDPRHAVVFVGYQASGTRGRALVNGADTVAIQGDLVPVRAEVSLISSLSSHADREELLRWCRAIDQIGTPPKRIFLNHGEDPARKSLAAAIEGLGWPRPALPSAGERADW